MTSNSIRFNKSILVAEIMLDFVLFDLLIISSCFCVFGFMGLSIVQIYPYLIFGGTYDPLI